MSLSPTPTEHEIELSDDTGTVWIRKHISKRGERAEIATDSDRIRLDALILESLSWQRSLEELAALLEDGAAVRADRTPITGGDPIPDSDPFTVSNEYAQATLTHVQTTVDEGLQVSVSARGSKTTLGVGTLRALAAHTDTGIFSEFFKTPVGPEDTRLEGPH